MRVFFSFFSYLLLLGKIQIFRTHAICLIRVSYMYHASIAFWRWILYTWNAQIVVAMSILYKCVVLVCGCDGSLYEWIEIKWVVFNIPANRERDRNEIKNETMMVSILFLYSFFLFLIWYVQSFNIFDMASFWLFYIWISFL